MNLVKIGTTDISENILTDSYDVNQNSIYKEWEDGNGIIHRDRIRDQIVGSFNMKFKTEEAYNTFIGTVKAVTTNPRLIPCTVYVNNIAEIKTGYFYYTLSVSMHKNISTGKIFKRVTMKIKER